MRWSALWLVLLAACGGSDGVFTVLSPRAGGVANEARPLVRWTAGGVSYRLRVYADEARTVLLEEQEVARPEARLATPLSDGDRVWVDVESLPSGMRTGPVGFRVVLVPPYFPEIELVRNEAASRGGYKLFNLLDVVTPDGEEKVPAMALVNDAAEVVWWYAHPAPGILTDPRVLPGGTITFVVRDRTNPAGVTSVGYEMTWDGAILWESRPGALLHHELAPGPGGNRLYLVYLSEIVGGVSYESDGLELVDPQTNDVLWSWSLLDHFRPEDFQGIPEAEFEGISGLGRDWSHSNSAVWDEARSLVWVSIRHFDRIVGVDYPSGEIRVTVGEGGLGPPGYMSRQHAPEVQADGSILFFDNGSGQAPPRTSVKQFDFDEVAGTFEPLFEWSDSPPFHDFALGDADRLSNGNILVTAGVSRRIIEIDPQGRIVWELKLSGDRHWIYRTQQVPEERIPAWVMQSD